MTRIHRPLIRLLIVAFAAFMAVPASARAQQVDDIVGKMETYVIRKGDILPDLAWENDLGYVEMVAANPGVDPWVPKPGTEIILPTAHLLPMQREGIVIDLSALRLYYFPPDGSEIETFPIGIGRAGLTTPLGETKIVRKQRDPVWRPTPATREARPELPAAIGPGPDNPLGKFALYLGWPTYVVHGTNKPFGIGRRVSRGCIRLYPEDIFILFEMAKIGTKVTVIDDPVKLGWREGELYLEVHASKRQIDQIERSGRFDNEPIADLKERVVSAARGAFRRIDWAAVELAARERRGYPVRITH